MTDNLPDNLPDRPQLPGIEEYAAEHLAARLDRLATRLRDWAETVDRAAAEVRGLHATSLIPRPYAFTVSQMSGPLQGITHDLACLGADAAEVETYRAVDDFRSRLSLALRRAEAQAMGLPPDSGSWLDAMADFVADFAPQEG